MSIKQFTTYVAEIDDQEFEVPFEYIDGTEVLKIDGDKARLGVLCQDDSPEDPFVAFDEGEFHQFDSSYIHYTPRPDLTDFKRLVRANPGRVVLTSWSGDCHGPGTTNIYPVSETLQVQDTKGDSLQKALNSAGGYYITPVDLTEVEAYAESVLKDYTVWCNGGVYGVCVWTYERTEDGWALIDAERDDCWGYYGYEYAEETLNELMEAGL
jgi:hypothetical protein